MEIVMKRRGKMEIWLKAVAEDEARKEFQAVIKFSDIDGNDRLLSVPLSDLEDLKVLRKTLRNAGCYFSKSGDKAKAALTALAGSTANAKRWKFPARVGWYDGHRQFVHRQRVLGKMRDHTLIKPLSRMPEITICASKCGALTRSGLRALRSRWRIQVEWCSESAWRSLHRFSTSLVSIHLESWFMVQGKLARARSSWSPGQSLGSPPSKSFQISVLRMQP
jgi:hypothetical protein